MSCDTREKVRSGPEVVRKTFRIFDFSPVDGGGKGFVGNGVTCAIHVGVLHPPLACTRWVNVNLLLPRRTLPCNTFAANSGSLPHRQDVVRSSRRCLANLSITSAHTYLPQNLAHCSARKPLPWSRNVGFAPGELVHDVYDARNRSQETVSAANRRARYATFQLEFSECLEP